MTSFGSIFRSLLRSSRVRPLAYKKYECLTYHEQRCTICSSVQWPYEEEIKIKDQAFKEFWSRNRLDGKPDPLVASPKGRFYRTQSKRRVFSTRDGMALGLTGLDASGRIRPLDVIECRIEMKEHSRIYNLVQQFIDSREGRTLGHELNYVIVRGHYEQITVIFSVKQYSTPQTATINQLSKLLTREIPAVSGVYTFLDEHSRYYLSDKADTSTQGLRKIFGKKNITETIGGNVLSYAPLVFSQTNSSLIDGMIQKAAELLKPQGDELLYDLYCGYGALTLPLAMRYAGVHGVELSPEAVASAKANADHLKVKNVRFTCAAIDEETIRRFPMDERTVVLLDPPRNGVDKGVIEWLAGNGIKKALHLFCEIDLIPEELERWRKKGYRPARIVPLDMFPATDNVETMILLQPA